MSDSRDPPSLLERVVEVTLQEAGAAWHWGTYATGQTVGECSVEGPLADPRDLGSQNDLILDDRRGQAFTRRTFQLRVPISDSFGTFEEGMMRLSSQPTRQGLPPRRANGDRGPALHRVG